MSKRRQVALMHIAEMEADLEKAKGLKDSEKYSFIIRKGDEDVIRIDDFLGAFVRHGTIPMISHRLEMWKQVLDRENASHVQNIHKDFCTLILSHSGPCWMPQHIEVGNIEGLLEVSGRGTTVDELMQFVEKELFAKLEGEKYFVESMTVVRDGVELLFKDGNPLVLFGFPSPLALHFRISSSMEHH